MEPFAARKKSKCAHWGCGGPIARGDIVNVYSDEENAPQYHFRHWLERREEDMTRATNRGNHLEKHAVALLNALQAVAGVDKDWLNAQSRELMNW